MLISFEINVPKHITKKNGRPIYRGRIGKSPELATMENYLTAIMRSQYRTAGLKEPLAPPYHVTYEFIFGPENSRSFKLCDLSNLIELPQDCLQQAGVIENDRFIQSVDGTRKRMGPRNLLRVTIRRYNEI